MNVTLTYSASVHTRKKIMVATPTFAAQFTIQTKLRMDSRLHTKNLNSPLVSSGLICYRTIKHVTTLPPGVRCVTGTSSTAYATPGCSRPHTALRDTPSQTKTVISCLHTAKEHCPVQSQTHSVSPLRPRTASQFGFSSGNAAPHPSSCWQDTHSKVNCSLSLDLEASLRLLTSPKVSTTPATEQGC